MSDIEQSLETIQAPIKRKYTRKPRSPIQGLSHNPNDKVVIEPPVEVSITDGQSPRSEAKPKRTYTRKPKPEMVYEPIVHDEPEPEPEKHEPEPNKQKKARSEKQIAAFNKMREARIKKQAELEDLKAFQKEKELLEKEQSKIQKIEEKIVKKRQPKKSKHEQVYNEPEPEHIIQVSNNRPIMFV
jgi:hypothetical protein